MVPQKVRVCGTWWKDKKRGQNISPNLLSPCTLETTPKEQQLRDSANDQGSAIAPLQQKEPPKHLLRCMLIRSERGGGSVTDLC